MRRERLTDCILCHRPGERLYTVPGWIIFACPDGHFAIGWPQR